MTHGPVIGISASGGAMRGVIGGEHLKEMEARTGLRIRECVDIMAGTSTGGIQCSLFASPRRPTADDALSFYYESGPRIFSSSVWKRIATTGGMTGTRYSGKTLGVELLACIGDYTIEQAETKLLIPAADAIQREPVFFKSWQESFAGFKMRDVAQATASAQSYFPATRMTIDGRETALIDGGNFKNAPMACLAFEMIALWPGREIVIIHLGTGKQRNPKPLPTNSGMLAWASEVFGCMTELQDDCDDYFCRRLAEIYPCRYYRFDIEVEQFPAMDDARTRTLDGLRAQARAQRPAAEFEAVCGLLSARAEAKRNG